MSERLIQAQLVNRETGEREMIAQFSIEEDEMKTHEFAIVTDDSPNFLMAAIDPNKK